MKIYISFLGCLLPLLGMAQAKTAANGWHLQDKTKDGVYGIGLERAYQLLKDRSSQTVVVAVIDSGIDTTHEDLQPILWTNPKEIPGNGKDDDGNGYTDDLHGWNFCGSPDGTNLDRNTHETARMYHNWRGEFEGKKEKDIADDRKWLYRHWKRAEQLLNEQYEKAVKTLPGLEPYLNALQATSRLMNTFLGKTAFTLGDIPDITTRDSMGFAARLWSDVLKRGGPSISSATVLAELDNYKNQLINGKNRKEQLPEDLRGKLVKDVYTDINDRIYGNNNLKSGSGNHGTSVAGAIAALRGNGIGMDGIADNVRIMAIRAVPGGDEHDKDVALAIRYAVDNGASIINMSFGKPVSPYKYFVDEAIQYAAAKGVLLVHGSGNDAKNLDEDPFYPSPIFNNGTKATNMITVGASGNGSGDAITAPFSNYSKNIVDIFAPGMHIYTTTTGNGYEAADGTSLASPVVAGVAALLKSYFPKLTPEQVISILTGSGTVVTEKVPLPGDDKKMVAMKQLAVCGCIVNAGAAVEKAMELYGR